MSNQTATDCKAGGGGENVVRGRAMNTDEYMASQPKIIHWRRVLDANGAPCCALHLDENGKLGYNGNVTPLFQSGASLQTECDPLPSRE